MPFPLITAIFVMSFFLDELEDIESIKESQQSENLGMSDSQFESHISDKYVDNLEEEDSISSDSRKSSNNAITEHSSHEEKLRILNNKMSVVGSMVNKTQRATYKAYAVAILDEEHIPLALNQISMKDEKFIQAKNVVLAYRISSLEGLIPHSESKFTQLKSLDSSNIDKNMIEGFDDSDIEG